MSYQLISIIISFVIFTSYITYIAINYGVLPSVSDSYYSLPKHRRWLFTITFWSFSFPLIIAGETGLMFLAGASICFTGAAPAFDPDREANKSSTMQRKVHIMSAIVGITASVFAIFFNFGASVIGIITLGSIIALKLLKVNNVTWWIEVVAYYAILSTLLLHIL
jgi:hypothetical protein